MLRVSRISVFLCQAVIQLLLLLAGDVEQNPGPPKVLKQASHLGIHHLKDVHEELIGVSHKWYDIGLQLSLPVGTLEKIRELYSDPQSRLREVLKTWLVTVNPYPTWRTLVKVLKRQAVGEHSLADELKVKHCKGKGKERTHAVSSPKAHTKVELVKVKREPSDDSADNELLPDEVTSPPLCSESLNPSERDTCGQDAGSSGTASHEHLQKPVFGCGCKHCTIANFMDGCKKPISTETGLPYLDASGLTEVQKDTLVGRLLYESREMLIAFQRLLSTAIMSLKRRKIPPEDLVTELMSFGALDPVLNKAKVPDTPTTVLRERLKELRDAKSINDVFFIVNDYVSFFNYEIIEHIIKVFGTKDDQEAVRLYKEIFESYCKRRVFECPPHVYGSRSESGLVRLVVKKDDVLGKYNMNELKLFQYKLGRILQVTEHTPQLVSVEEGCLQLTFQIPAFVQHLVFPLSADQEKLLQAEGVLALICGDYKFLAQEHAEDEDATSISLDIPPDMFDDAAAMLDRVCIEPAAVYSQATSPHFAKMEVLNLASEGLNDGPGTPLQHVAFEDSMFSDRQKRKLGEEHWEEELIPGLKRSRLQVDSEGVPDDFKPLDMKQEPPVGTFGSILGESVESEASRGKVEEESIKPEVEGDPGMERKPKAEPDSQFSIKTEWWMKTEKEMKMEWMPPADSKCIGRGTKTGLIENVEDLWDSVARLETIDPGLYKVVSGNVLRLHAEIYMLEEELACKEKELAWKDDLLTISEKQKQELLGQFMEVTADLRLPMDTEVEKSRLPKSSEQHISELSREADQNSGVDMLQLCYSDYEKRVSNAVRAWVTSDDVCYLFAAQSLIAEHERVEPVGDTALHLAIINNKQDKVLQLLDLIFLQPPTETPIVDCLNNFKQSPLHLAVLTRQQNVIQSLLKANANPLIYDCDGNTPLHVACKMGFVQGVVAILSRTHHLNQSGCRIPELSIRNSNGFTPLLIAAISGRCEVLKRLLTARPDVDIQDAKSGKTALHHSVELEDLKMIAYLVSEADAKVDCCDFSGHTPLHVAADQGNTSIVSLLIAAGSKVTVWSAEGETPLQMAERRKHKEVAILLREAMHRTAIVDNHQMESVSTKPEQKGDLDFQTRISLAKLLDPISEGRDWRELCRQLGLTSLKPGLKFMTSPTKELLTYYLSVLPCGNVATVRESLVKMKRIDAVNIIDRALMEDQREPTVPELTSKGGPNPTSRPRVRTDPGGLEPSSSLTGQPKTAVSQPSRPASAHVAPHPPPTSTTPYFPPPAGGESPTPTTANPAAKQPSKGLRLTPQQAQIAQDMFKESPSLTREQKSLMLAFMAGSRENPHPGQPVVRIKLNEKHTTEHVDSVGQPATVRHVLFETVFEMNYSSGQWRKLLIKRPIDTWP